jgi:hypothetical protein
MARGAHAGRQYNDCLLRGQRAEKAGATAEADVWYALSAAWQALSFGYYRDARKK